MDNIIETSNSSISRRDFLKLKSFLILWYYFFQSFGINLFASDTIKKVDYSLLDKLLNMKFSPEVMDELKQRVELQKKYNTDANGNIVSLDRFIKEITNFIISKRDFEDFKLLNSIKDEQIDYSYMLNATAKHNEVNSMQYLQQKLIGHKDDTMLNNALEYAIKSQSFDTTLHLMQQKLKLNSSSQKELLNVLHKEEYEIFYKKISSNDTMFLPSYSKEDIIKKRKMDKKTFSIYEFEDLQYNHIYDYLTTILHNSMVELYIGHSIDDFDLSFYSNKAHVTTYSNSYPINFIKEFEESLYRNGFDSWSDDLICLYGFEEDGNKIAKIEFTDMINKFIYDGTFCIDDFITIDMM